MFHEKRDGKVARCMFSKSCQKEGGLKLFFFGGEGGRGYKRGGGLKIFFGGGGFHGKRGGEVESRERGYSSFPTRAAN